MTIKSIHMASAELCELAKFWRAVNEMSFDDPHPKTTCASDMSSTCRYQFHAEIVLAVN